MLDDPYRNPLSSPERRAQYEYRLALDCTVPMLRSWGLRIQDAQVLDLGCGSGGLVVALAERGAVCVGVDRDEKRIRQAWKMAAERGVEARFLIEDILLMTRVKGRFELMVLSEVVEHLRSVQNVETLLCWCGKHLAPGGSIYVSFPPWFNPFGGHQAGWPRIRYLPWYHLLPDRLKLMLVPERGRRYVEFAQELNHLTIDAFEKLLSRVGLTAVVRRLYAIRPEYRWRYGLPVLPLPFPARIPGIREVTTTGAFYLLARDEPGFATGGETGSLAGSLPGRR